MVSTGGRCCRCCRRVFALKHLLEEAPKLRSGQLAENSTVKIARYLDIPQACGQNVIELKANTSTSGDKREPVTSDSWLLGKRRWLFAPDLRLDDERALSLAG